MSAERDDIVLRLTYFIKRINDSEYKGFEKDR